MLHHFTCVYVVRIIGGLPIRLSCVLCQEVAQLLLAFSYPAPPSPEVCLSAAGRQLEAVLTAIGLSDYCVPEEVTRTGQQHSSQNSPLSSVKLPTGTLPLSHSIHKQEDIQVFQVAHLSGCLVCCVSKLPNYPPPLIFRA